MKKKLITLLMILGMTVPAFATWHTFGTQTNVPFSWLDDNFNYVVSLASNSAMTWPGSNGVVCYAGSNTYCTSYNAGNQIPFSYIDGAQPYSTNLDLFANVDLSANAATFLTHDFSEMKTDLGLGTAAYQAANAFQTASATLNSLAGITFYSDMLSFLGAANYTAMVADLGLTIGTNTQAYSAYLTGINQGLSTSNSPTFAGLTLSNMTGANESCLYSDTNGVTHTTGYPCGIGGNVTGAPPLAYYVVTRPTNLPTNGIDLSALSSGLLYSTSSANVSTISVKTIGTDVQAHSNNLDTFANVTPTTIALNILGSNTGAAIYSLIGTAPTATLAAGANALASTPSKCSAGSAPIGVNADGSADGCTAYEASNSNLDSLAGLNFTVSSVVRMTGANTFGLDTTSYQTALTNPVTGTGAANSWAYFTGSTTVTGANITPSSMICSSASGIPAVCGAVALAANSTAATPSGNTDVANKAYVDSAVQTNMTSGTFVPTVTGFSGSPTVGTAYWKFSNKICTLSLGNLTGTSNATTFTITNLPATVTPSRTKIFQVYIEDNGSWTWGIISIASNSVVTFGKVFPTDGGFTASGTKAVWVGQTFVYDKD